MTAKPTFCPACESDRIENASAFGYDGPWRPHDGLDAVLCDKHADDENCCPCDCPRCSGHPEDEGPCEYCGKDGHNGGCRAQERHDARCL